MSLPTSYLTSTKNLDGIFAAIQNAKAPEKFTTRFLESLDFKTATDRLIIGVLKSLGFLDGEGRPQDRYFRFLDQTQSAAVMAEAVEDAYADLFGVNRKAHLMSKPDIVGKLKTLTQGSVGESVLDKMAMTFLALAKLADFDAKPEKAALNSAETAPEKLDGHAGEIRRPAVSAGIRELGGLHYNIQIILPESRDPKVYDALFRSLREHLLS